MNKLMTSNNTLIRFNSFSSGLHSTIHIGTNHFGLCFLVLFFDDLPYPKDINLCQPIKKAYLTLVKE